MAEQNQFGPMPGATPGGGGLRCEEWEALLVDALDGLLPAADAAAFRAHSASCANCGDLLAHAEQGRQWLGYLHTEPDVPAGLLSRILDKTVGAGSVPLPVVAAGQGAGTMTAAIPWTRNFHETRLLMTVAMAFFSIAMTLSLAGVKVSNLRLADLRPSVIGGTISRQFYSAQKQVVQYYDNLRIVYQLESRMRELRRQVETVQPNPPRTQPSQPSSDKDGQLNGAPSRGEVVRVRTSARRSGPAGIGRASSGNSTALDAARGELRRKLEQEPAGARLAQTGTTSDLDHPRAGLQRAADAAEKVGRSLA